MSADMFHLQETAEELLALAQQNQWAESLAWAHYFLGNALYARNDLVGAGKHYASVVGMRHSVASAVVIHSTFGMACVLHAQGDPEAASAAAGLAYDYVRRPGKEPLQQQVIAFQAYLAARQGQLEEALRWVAGANRATLETPMPHFFAAGVAMADILVRVGAPACLAEAAQLLERLERYLAATHNTRLLAEVLLLRASLDCARQQMDSAHARLAAAVKIAEPRKLLRMFLDAPDILDALLCQFNGTSQHAAFVLQVSDARALARATGRRHPGTPVQPQPGKAAIIQPRHPDLIESLTARELEVLEMLAQRLTNKEIAAALGISVGTAKQHTRAVLSKLHAGNRRDAIAQARSMGFQLEGPIGW
jgi:LuxR family maltose regulon positive regulatory protein